MYYSFTGLSGGQYNYRVTLKLLTDCESRRKVDELISVGVFSRYSGAFIRNISVGKSSIEDLNLTNPDPCITNPPVVCYNVSYFNFDLSLPVSEDGYILTSQVNYRVNGLANLFGGYSNIGASYSAEIPGTSGLTNAPENNSAIFTGTDLVAICANHTFTYSFAAKDSDGDQLIYSFCDAQNTNAGGGGNIQNPTPPPFASLPYGPLYSGLAPLSNTVEINSETGLITGIAPAGGKYVVTVCVQEIRNNKVIATQRKDIQIKIASCSIAEAAIPDEYLLCKDTKTINLVNSSSSPLINSLTWEIKDNSNTSLLVSNDAQVNYTFGAIGLYTVKLYINPGQACSDSASAMVRVYPGFVPGISFTGICVNKPTFFKDITTSVYGMVDSWSWDFGKPGQPNNNSMQKDPSYTYTSNGVSDVRLVVENSVGCRDTVYRKVETIDRPPINLPFKDTLVCLNDQLQLKASGSGVLAWGPANIVNSTAPDPIVSPLTTTTFIVNIDDNGCKNTDSLKVRVVDRVTIQAMNDTTICKGDTIRLRLESDGLQYAWTPSVQLIDATAKNPLAITGTTTSYSVNAIIGGCSATANVIVGSVPYPIANAGADTTICFNTPAQLRGSTDGNSLVWSPGSSLNSITASNPVAKPRSTTTYILSGYDSRSSCPKPGRDTVTVNVQPDIIAYAGNDTAILTGQPMRFNARGGVRYLWMPATGLSSAETGNPVGNYNTASTGIEYKVLVYDAFNCVDSDYVKIKIFDTAPSVFVPNAFSPNKDGVNDRLRPIPVGITRMDYFYIYNRWGQLVYSGTDTEGGWDGTVAGKMQRSDTYIWVVKGVDYLGRPYFTKGSSLLIR